MNPDRFAAYPRHDPTKRRWSRGRVLSLFGFLVSAVLTYQIWCGPGIMLASWTISRWPSGVTASIGLALLTAGALLARFAYIKLGDARVGLRLLALCTSVAFLIVPPGTILLVEGIGYLFGSPR